MSFQAPLRIGKTLLFPHQLLSFSFLEQGLLVNAATDILQLQGEGLPHCVMDLLHDLCADIQPAPLTALPPLEWQVNTITTAKRIPMASTAAVINPFEGIVPTGWLLFEMGSGWHFWPAKTLIAIAQTRTALLFVYDSVTAEVQASPSTLPDEFDRWVKGGITARHYTERAAADYSGLLPVERFAATDIRLRTCDPQRGLKGKRIEQWYSFSDKLPEPQSQKICEIER